MSPLRALIVLLAAFLLVGAPAHAQSFAQLTGEAGCVVQRQNPSGELTGCAVASGLMNARSVAVSPDQQHVYVTSAGGAVTGSNGIALLSRDGATGALTFGSCVTSTGGDGRIGSDGLCGRADALRGARELAFSPDGKHVYVAATGSSAVSWFDRDPTTGALTQRGCIKHMIGFGEHCAGGYALDGAAGVAVSPDGRFVYVASERSNAVAVFARDETTGALTEQSCVSDTGSDGTCADGTALAGAERVLMAADGADLYVTSSLAGAITGYRRDAATGKLTPQGCLLADAPAGGPCTDVPALEGARGGAISADGRSVYVAAEEHGTLVTLARDPNTGALAAAGCLQQTDPTREEIVDPDEFFDEEEEERVPGCSPAAALLAASGVTVSADGRSVFATGRYSLTAFRRDPATGALTQFGCVESDPSYKTCSQGRRIEEGSGLAASSDGRSLYLVSSRTNSVAVFGATVAIASASAKVQRRSGTIRVRLSCPRVAARGCAGDIRVTGARAARFRLAAGAAGSVRMRVSRGAVRHRVAIVVARDTAARTSDVRRRLTLRP